MDVFSGISTSQPSLHISQCLHDDWKPLHRFAIVSFRLCQLCSVWFAEELHGERVILEQHVAMVSEYAHFC